MSVLNNVKMLEEMFIGKMVEHCKSGEYYHITGLGLFQTTNNNSLDGEVVVYYSPVKGDAKFSRPLKEFFDIIIIREGFANKVVPRFMFKGDYKK